VPDPTPPDPVVTLPTIPSTTAPTSTTLGPDPGRWFDRVIVIVMENADAPVVLADPNFAAVADRGTRFSGSVALAHPSQPNYLAMVAGDTFITDSSAHHLAVTNLVDLLEPRGISWRAYLEGYPGGCSDVDQATTRGLSYVRRHNPFVTFDDIRTNAARCAHLVDEQAFAADVAAGTLPQYAFYVPDLIHDGHDSSIATAGAWLTGFLQPLLADAPTMAGTLIVVTYDEGSGTADPATQPIYTVAIGSGATPGAVVPTAIDHDGLRRTIELNWQLGSLGRHDATATAWPLAARG
jgi:acid phosphatase